MPHNNLEEVARNLGRIGISYPDAVALRRISMTLRRWHELECNGDVERDEETGKPFWPRIKIPMPDRETGARKRLAKIMANYPDLVAYVQTDPRGCALYILRQEQVGDQPIDCIYNRGVAVYK